MSRAMIGARFKFPIETITGNVDWPGRLVEMSGDPKHTGLALYRRVAKQGYRKAVAQLIELTDTDWVSLHLADGGPVGQPSALASPLTSWDHHKAYDDLQFLYLMKGGYVEIYGRAFGSWESLGYMHWNVPEDEAQHALKVMHEKAVSKGVSFTPDSLYWMPKLTKKPKFVGKKPKFVGKASEPGLTKPPWPKPVEKIFDQWKASLISQGSYQTT